VQGRLEALFNKYVWNVSKKDVGPTYDLKGTEAWSKIYGYGDDFYNEKVTERRAHGLATVFTCLNVRSRTIASLPLNPMIEENGKKEVLTDHSVYYPLAQQANSYMSSAQLFLTSMILADSWGNSVIYIHRDSRQRPYAFSLLQPDEWSVVTLNGDAFYKINGVMEPARNVLHFRWFSLDGLMGISPIRQNQITFGAAFKQARYQATTLTNRPPGILSYEGVISPTAQEENKKNWKKDIDAGQTPILSGNWKFQPIIIPPGEAEYIQTANLTEREICGIYQMPPTFIQNYDRATWSNAEQADLVYAKHTVTPICRIIEQECNMKLFTEKEKKNHFVKFNLNGLLRGDIAARAAFYTAMRNIGGMNGDEIRDREDMNSYEGGEIFTVQGANIPIDQLKKHYESMAASASQGPQPRNGQKVNGHAHELYN
jgi:HK97 family phage portal protein